MICISSTEAPLLTTVTKQAGHTLQRGPTNASSAYGPLPTHTNWPDTHECTLEKSPLNAAIAKGPFLSRGTGTFTCNNMWATKIPNASNAIKCFMLEKPFTDVNTAQGHIRIYVPCSGICKRTVLRSPFSAATAESHFCGMVSYPDMCNGSIFVAIFVLKLSLTSRNSEALCMLPLSWGLL